MNFFGDFLNFFGDFLELFVDLNFFGDFPNFNFLLLPIPRKLLFATLLLTALLASVTSMDVLCQFKTIRDQFGERLGCEAESVDDDPNTCNCDNRDPDELYIDNPEDLPPGKTEDDIEFFNFTDLPLRRFPRNLRKFWKLKTLDFENCGLEDLRSSYFSGLDFLLSARFPRNKLKKLPGRLFRNNRW